MGGYQSEWDRQLVMGWRRDSTMMGVVIKFLSKVNSGLLAEEGGVTSFDDVANYLSFLDLRRCGDRGSEGRILFQGFRVPARAFVAQRSKMANNWLWGNSGFMLNDGVDAISRFKWSRLALKVRTKAHNKKRYSKIKAKSFVVVKARDLDKKSDWRLTK